LDIISRGKGDGRMTVTMEPKRAKPRKGKKAPVWGERGGSRNRRGAKRKEGTVSPFFFTLEGIKIPGNSIVRGERKKKVRGLSNRVNRAGGGGNRRGGESRRRRTAQKKGKVKTS